VICCHRSTGIELASKNFKHLRLNITTGSLGQIERASPDIIIHAAALTNLEFCEKNPELAYDVNVNGTRNILKAAEKCGAKLVYICTDYIFDGNKGQYSEIDEPNPLSVYAKTKLQGEDLIRKNYDDFLSIRTSLHGWNPNPIKLSLSSSVIDSLRKNRVFYATDQISSLMFTNDFATILIEMLERDLTGIYNVASSDSMSKYHFSLAVADVFKLNGDLVKPVSLDEFRKKFFLIASRPKNISLNVSKIEGALGKRMRTVLDGIISMEENEADFKRSVRWLNAS
jgi:dTDP-4-dehydrorhamnose reductase